MFNVCQQCGLYRVDKIIDPAGPVAICPECGHRHPFLALPLMIVTGASGSGKSTLCAYLSGGTRNAVLLDSDILWRPEFNKPEENYRDYFDMWLRMAKNIGQSGRPVVLFGAGIGVPHNIEGCTERRYLAGVHYLSLVCSDDVLAQRLQQRPSWRQSSQLPFITEQQRFNHWFREYNQNAGHPPITLVDTSTATLEETAQAVATWIDGHVAAVA